MGGEGCLLAHSLFNRSSRREEQQQFCSGAGWLAKPVKLCSWRARHSLVGPWGEPEKAVSLNIVSHCIQQMHVIRNMFLNQLITCWYQFMCHNYYYLALENSYICSAVSENKHTDTNKDVIGHGSEDTNLQTEAFVTNSERCGHGRCTWYKLTNRICATSSCLQVNNRTRKSDVFFCVFFFSCQREWLYRDWSVIQNRKRCFIQRMWRRTTHRNLHLKITTGGKTSTVKTTRNRALCCHSHLMSFNLETLNCRGETEKKNQSDNLLFLFCIVSCVLEAFFI